MTLYFHKITEVVLLLSDNISLEVIISYNLLVLGTISVFTLYVER